MKKLKIIFIFLLILFSGCCYLPFIDCFVPYVYKPAENNCDSTITIWNSKVKRQNDTFYYSVKIKQYDLFKTDYDFFLIHKKDTIKGKEKKESDSIAVVNFVSKKIPKSKHKILIKNDSCKWIFYLKKLW